MLEALSKDITNRLSAKPEILACYVIGSYVYGNQGNQSDFDLAVVVSNKTKIGEKEVYNLLEGIKFPCDLDLSVVDRKSSPLFLFQIVKKGRRIYEKDQKAVIDFEAYALHNYYDTARMRKLYFNYLKQGFNRYPYVGR